MIGLSFVFFGLNYSFVGSPYAAKVDGEEIDAGVFEQNYRDAIQRNPQLATVEGELRIQIRRSLLDQLISRQLIENYLDDNGYRISDEQIIRYIQDTPEFQVDGKFDRDTYRTFLAERSLEPIQFEQMQRDSMRQQQLQAAIGATALVTPAEYRRYLNLVAEQRVVSVAKIGEPDVADEIDVTDAMVTAYYENNPTLFQEPESADVEYIRITRDAVADEIAVAESDLEKYYQQNRDRYLQDEQRRISHILILTGDDDEAARSKAEAALARVNGGESFADVAADVSEDTGTAEQGGSMGTLTRSQLSGDLASVVFSLNQGDVDGPVKSDFGYHIVKVDEVMERGPLPLDQVRGELLSELREREVDDRFRDLESSLSNALFDHADIESIAAATGLKVQSATGITRAGGEPFGSNQLAIDTIFGDNVLIDGEVSEVVELDANSAAIFKVSKHHEASRQPLEEVRDEVVAALRSEQAETIMSGRVEQMTEAVKGGEDFLVAAETAGLDVAEPQLIARNDRSVDQALLFEVFAAGKPATDSAITGQVRMQDGSFAVYKIDAVLPGRPESIPLAERDQGKQMLAQQSGIGDFQAFLQALQADAKIVINDDVLAADDLFQ
jgi:peptidyl-prolyl cis-trans isomerase D